PPRRRPHLVRQVHRQLRRRREAGHHARAGRDRRGRRVSQGPAPRREGPGSPPRRRRRPRTVPTRHHKALSTATVATRPRGWREIERRALELELRFQLVLEDCRRSGLYYIERFAYTVDEHCRTDNERPLIHGPKWIDPETLMPARDLDPEAPDDYLRYIAAVWLQEPLILVPKSRQLRLSHLMVHLHGWLAMFYPGQLIGFQSKKFEDADALLRRLDLGLRAQRKFHPHIPWPPYKRIKGAIIFP